MSANRLDFESLVQSARELLDAVVSLDQSYQTLAGIDPAILSPEAAQVREQQLQQLARMHAAIEKGLRNLFTSTAATQQDETEALDCCLCGHVRGQHASPEESGEHQCMAPGCLCPGFTLAPEETAPRA